ncbi:MAG: cysteine--tRNA ligase [Thermoplasmata archaeon]|nr:MAG: cysteine--tRNA ligase [Thermoplasmata archaeon]RLF28098.1 MAG: cysteine--tRNA ligase [Thermoplasmata archaeon]
MTLRIYNTLTRKKEVFTPVEKGKVKMYVCGMTVYSDAHIGHARTYLAFDVVRRYFEYKGFDVFYVQNITDVDDKIIASANQRGEDPLEYSRRYTERCLEALDALGIRRADLYPKASETIPDMIKMIERIIEKGYGYVADGDVYFSVERFPEYGKLSNQRIEELEAGARIEPGEKKRNPLDFALWKKAKPGEPWWESPWGKGRPGWHIECSTMSSKYLGLPFDIHGGGMDLKFPHHENEIAQAEAATGKPFARYWMHVGLLTVNGEKMSKSLGNIINIKDLLERWDAEVIRFFFVQNHYRSPPDFSEKALQDAEKSLERIHRLKERLKELSEREKNGSRGDEKGFLSSIEGFKEKFELAMDDDFNTPRALGVIFDFIGKTNKFLEETEEPASEVCRRALDTLVKLCNVLTLLQDESKQEVDLNEMLPLLEKYELETLEISSGMEALELLLKVREDARAKRDWKKADAIRDDLQRIGFEVEDTESGPRWRKKRVV